MFINAAAAAAMLSDASMQLMDLTCPALPPSRALAAHKTGKPALADAPPLLPRPVTQRSDKLSLTAPPAARLVDKLPPKLPAPAAHKASKPSLAHAPAAHKNKADQPPRVHAPAVQTADLSPLVDAPAVHSADKVPLVDAPAPCAEDMLHTETAVSCAIAEPPLNDAPAASDFPDPKPSAPESDKLPHVQTPVAQTAAEQPPAKASASDASHSPEPSVLPHTSVLAPLSPPSPTLLSLHSSRKRPRVSSRKLLESVESQSSKRRAGKDKPEPDDPLLEEIDANEFAQPVSRAHSAHSSSSSPSYAGSPPATARSSSSSSIGSLPGLDSDPFELSASSPSASPPAVPASSQRLVWVGMSSAARNPVAARHKQELKEKKERQKQQKAQDELAASKRAKLKKAAAAAHIPPQRMSARVVALQQAQSEREKARKARRAGKDDEREEDEQDDEDDEGEEDEESDQSEVESGRRYNTQHSSTAPPSHKQKGKKKWGRPPSTSAQSSSQASSRTSQSASTAVATTAQSPHSFLESIASLSRVGFEQWRLVPPQSIPHMTYEGYVALAFDSLEPSSRRAMARALPYVAEHEEEYHSTPWPLIWGQTPSPLSLYRRVDRVYGKEEQRVCASRRIEAKEVVGFLAGRLTEQSKAQKEAREDDHHHFFMERSYLRTFFEYAGEHSLMISTKEHKSVVSYIRDPCEKTDGEDANIKVDVVLDPVTHLFFVVLYAAAPIARGEELYCLPFLGKFLSRAHRQMFLYARISHYYHRYATLLERALLSHPEVEWDRQVPAGIEARPLTAEQEALHYGDEEERSRVYQIALDEGYLQWDVQTALLVSKCRYVKLAYLGSAVSDEVRQRMGEIADHLPDTVTVDGQKVRADTASLLTIVTCGHDAAMIEVREDRCIGSPVRYFDVPSRPSFCVMARQPIAPGTFVFTYAGEVSEQVINYSSTYVYNLCAADIRRAVPGYTALPNLYLDAMASGSIARFVNDNRYRLTEDGAPGSSANLDCTFLFHGGMLHLAFYAVRRIEAGEELVSQYGDDYWKTINSRLIDDHKDYYDYTAAYIQHMQNTLRQHDIPLPPKPDYRVETYRLFEHKPEPYPDAGKGVAVVGGSGGSGGGSSGEGEEDDPRYEVGAVLDHHPPSAASHTGVTHYLVQWVGYDGNTWESRDNMDGCMKLIDTYFELRRMERQRSGAVKSVARSGAKGKRKKVYGKA